MSDYLASLDQVKVRLNLAATDVVDDALLTSLLAQITARAEKECNRKFAYAQEIEEFAGDAQELCVSRCPIDETSTITFETRTNAADGWKAAVTDYLVRGVTLISLPQVVATPREQLRVTYMGGYNLPTVTLPEVGAPNLPDDLREAAIDQVYFWYQQRDRLGQTSVSSQGGSFSMPACGPLALLQQVQRVFKTYERLVLI